MFNVIRGNKLLRKLNLRENVSPVAGRSYFDLLRGSQCHLEVLTLSFCEIDDEAVSVDSNQTKIVECTMDEHLWSTVVTTRGIDGGLWRAHLARQPKQTQCAEEVARIRQDGPGRSQ